MRLADKVVVITGSGSGLGRDAALLFASEGATIITSDLVPGRAQTVAKEGRGGGRNRARTRRRRARRGGHRAADRRGDR